MGIKIAVCDDDPLVLSEMNNYIAAYSILKNEEIEFQSYLSTNSLLDNNENIDILFLDIRFESKDIGIEVAKSIRNQGNDNIIILLTSLNSKAIEGYEVGAYRYLVKPITREQIYSVLNSALAETKNSKRVLFIKKSYGEEVIPIKDILYIQSITRKRYLVSQRHTFETWESLKSLYSQLPHEQFSYAQKGYIINFNMIAIIRKSEVELVSGEVVTISRLYKDLFFKKYFDYVGRM